MRILPNSSRTTKASGNYFAEMRRPPASVRLTSVLALATALAAQQIESTPKPGKVYTYKLKNGATRQLDFPVYAEDKAPKVTKEVFKGYALYNSYCYRCHGTDATGGELAPDLRMSLNSGMKQQGFIATAMAGKKDKGMPSWSGFLGQDDMIKIFRYVKARSLDLVQAGRPPSEQD